MKLTKEQIAEILYKSCEENDADIGSINFDAILNGLNKHLNVYLGQSLPIDSVSKRSFAVSYMGKDENGDIIKSIEVVEENESKAIEKVLEVNRSRDIYGAVEVDAC